MVIMKDSEDPPWLSVGDNYRFAVKYNRHMMVDKDNQDTFNYLVASECIYSAGRLVLFFKDKIPPRFHLHDKVITSVKITPYNK